MDLEYITRVQTKIDSLKTWKDKYEYFAGHAAFNWLIAEEVDAEFMRLAKQAFEPDLPFQDYCKSICLRDARFHESHKIWKKFSPERKEATYKILFEKRWVLWLKK